MRFGITGAAAATTTTAVKVRSVIGGAVLSAEDELRKKARAERFGDASTTADDVN